MSDITVQERIKLFKEYFEHIDAIQAHIAEQDKTIEMQRECIEGLNKVGSEVLDEQKQEIAVLNRALELMGNSLDGSLCNAWFPDTHCPESNEEQIDFVQCRVNYFKAQAAEELEVS